MSAVMFTGTAAIVGGITGTGEARTRETTTATTTTTTNRKYYWRKSLER
jgi:hypothetical protein